MENINEKNFVSSESFYEVFHLAVKCTKTAKSGFRPDWQATAMGFLLNMRDVDLLPAGKDGKYQQENLNKVLRPMLQGIKTYNEQSPAVQASIRDYAEKVLAPKEKGAGSGPSKKDLQAAIEQREKELLAAKKAEQEMAAKLAEMEKKIAAMTAAEKKVKGKNK
jgi:hypothetical protein